MVEHRQHGGLVRADREVADATLVGVALTGELAGFDRGGLVLQHARDERFAHDPGFDLGLPAQRVEELDTGPQVGVVDRDRHLLVRVEHLAEQRGVVPEEGTRRFGLVERRRLREGVRSGAQVVDATLDRRDGGEVGVSRLRVDLGQPLAEVVDGRVGRGRALLPASSPGVRRRC